MIGALVTMATAACDDDCNSTWRRYGDFWAFNQKGFIVMTDIMTEGIILDKGCFRELNGLKGIFSTGLTEVQDLGGYSRIFFSKFYCFFPDNFQKLH